MDIFFYIMIFIMGTFFGSFFTLAVYRIPLKKDITHERSFCPNCNHKLGALDLVPVFSYIFLKGKCRYCGEKIRIRYLFLEILSGAVFVIAFLSWNIQNIYFDAFKLIEFIFFVFMYVTLVLVAGIDKEHKKINFPVLTFGLVMQIVYILYLYIVGSANMYRYSIYFVTFILLFLIAVFVQKKKEIYWLQVFVLLAYIMAILGIRAIGIICGLSFVFINIWYFIKKQKYSEIPAGFVIAMLTIGYKLVENFIQFYII